MYHTQCQPLNTHEKEFLLECLLLGVNYTRGTAAAAATTASVIAGKLGLARDLSARLLEESAVRVEESRLLVGETRRMVDRSMVLDEKGQCCGA